MGQKVLHKLKKRTGTYEIGKVKDKKVVIDLTNDEDINAGISIDSMKNIHSLYFTYDPRGIKKILFFLLVTVMGVTVLLITVLTSSLDPCVVIMH